MVPSFPADQQVLLLQVLAPPGTPVPPVPNRLAQGPPQGGGGIELINHFCKGYVLSYTPILVVLVLGPPYLQKYHATHIMVKQERTPASTLSAVGPAAQAVVPPPPPPLPPSVQSMTTEVRESVRFD